MRELSQFKALEPGNGHGSGLLSRVCAEADRASVSLMLVADSERLGVWYERHGFGIVQLVPAVLMLRLPDGRRNREAKHS